MKNAIHPKWFPQAKVTCACGNTFTTGSVNEEIQVDLCSACHPFFTGEMRLLDRQGRAERFMQAQKAAKTSNRGGKKARKQKRQNLNDDSQTVQTFKDILQDERSQV
jgi:large subunit ribosomal protein L31